MVSLPEASRLLKIYRFDFIMRNMYWQKVISFKIYGGVMLLDILSSFAISYELGDFTPVTEAVSL